MNSSLTLFELETDLAVLPGNEAELAFSPAGRSTHTATSALERLFDTYRELYSHPSPLNSRGIPAPEPTCWSRMPSSVTPGFGRSVSYQSPAGQVYDLQVSKTTNRKQRTHPSWRGCLARMGSCTPTSSPSLLSCQPHITTAEAGVALPPPLGFLLSWTPHLITAGAGVVLLPPFSVELSRAMRYFRQLTEP